MAGPEHIAEKISPDVRRLIELHHPDWSPDDVEELTPRATHAIIDLVTVSLNLPKDPNQREPLLQRAMDHFNSRLHSTPEAGNVDPVSSTG